VSTCGASLYIHIPFCVRKCDYCDFYSACDLTIQNQLLGQIPRQMRELCSLYGIDSFRTLYLGGGTPGLVDTEALGRLLDAVKRDNRGGVLPAEVTLECNPGNIGETKLDEWKSMGITRLSLGVQSFQDDFLVKSGRKSSRKEILKALEMIRSFSEFDFNIDLIQGLPGMAVKDQLKDLEEAALWSPDHISWYSLILEEGTVLEKEWERRNGDAGSDNDKAWEEGCLFLTGAGYNRYEISNFSRAGKESLHNKSYWKLKPYLGCGPSAVSMLRDGRGRAVRFRTLPESQKYSEGIFLYDEQESLNPTDFLKDFMLMGLRLKEGIGLNDFEGIFGCQPDDLFPGSVKKWTDAGCLIRNEKTLSPTERGMNLLNSLLVDLFSELDGKVPEISLNWPLE